MYVANFPNIGFVGAEFDDTDLYSIRLEIDKIQNSFDTAEIINHAFTSTVKKEYKLNSSLKKLESLVLPLVNVYQKEFNYETKGSPYLESAWVNFQEAGEFFAPHTHAGEFSFALYIQVPFSIEDELKYVSTNDKSVTTATGFVFYYTDALGEIRPCYQAVDKTWENKILFFPGRMLHSVQPFFTSKDYRITVSGNIRFKDD